MREKGVIHRDKQSRESKLQSQEDNMKNAKNSKSGFKNTVSSGTQGAGDSFRHHIK